ncbi:MAG TPA: glucoamylase family protein [Rhodanobacteraceae bacterium]|nr:glucoamylase family protein [Rhodanobacteraceae bacterium]
MATRPWRIPGAALLALRRSGAGVAFVLLVLLSGAPVHAQRAAPQQPAVQPATLSLDDIEHRTFEFFWQTANPENGLVPDHWPPRKGTPYFSSIAAVGFALTAYPIGVERGWITREQARQRVLTTLRFFANAPQGASEDDDTGYHGFFYHFLDMKTGLRWSRRTEVSTIDTTLLMAGVLFDQTYFDQDNAEEREIRQIAENLYRNMDWNWAQVRSPLVSMGWTPGGKFIDADWQGYNEAMILYVLALGSPTHAVQPAAWKAWTSTYGRTWGRFHGSKPHIGFAPLFGHQYSESWIDFRGIQDAFMRAHDMDYFENSRRSVVGQRAYAIANPRHCTGYGADVWGLTASNGPGGVSWNRPDGTRMQFHGYLARGADVGHVVDDCTIVPTASIASIVFAPELVLPAIQAMYQRYGKWLYSKYGFVDAFNPTFRFDVTPRAGHVVPGVGWFDNAYLGIDQGPILLMIENYRSGFVWRVMRRNPHIRRGLERAGFKGGWLDKKPAGEATHATPPVTAKPATAALQ